MSGWRAPTALRWSGYIALAIVFAIACWFLSQWQFSRNAERAHQLALVAANYEQTPVALDELIPAGGSFDGADEWRPVRLEGTYLTDQQLLVRNRAHGGTAAFEVLVPFALPDGRTVIVDRGWVPPGESAEGPAAVPAAPSGEVTVIARLRPGEPLPASGRTAPEGQVPTINLPLVAEKLGGQAGDVETGAYALMVSEQPAPASAPQQLESPTADPGPFLSYAIQWILFAIMGFVFIGYVIHTERRHRREDAEDAAARAAGEPARVRPKREARRRDRDMEDEDALLDRVGH